MGKFLPDSVYPMAGMRSKRYCLAQLLLGFIIIPIFYLMYLISQLF